MTEPKWEGLWSAPNPRSPATGYDAGQRGWRLHLVDTTKAVQLTPKSAFRATAICGLSPRHGWGLDMFIDTPCSRCLKKAEKMGITTPEVPR